MFIEILGYQLILKNEYKQRHGEKLYQYVHKRIYYSVMIGKMVKIEIAMIIDHTVSHIMHRF